MTALTLFILAQIQFSPVATPPDFILNHNPTAQKHMVETMAGGLAVFDYNNDGKPDLFFTNGASLPDLKKKHSNRLFRNDGNFRFTDVTAEAKLEGEGYSTGAAAADFDNDGNVDLFVVGLYANHLYRNLGDGRFEEVKASGIASNEWSVAAGWFDYDNDGKVDLFVVNYGRIDLKDPRYCGDASRHLRVYCHPRYFDPRPNQIYRNLGNGKFENTSVSSGISKFAGRGMSVAFADYDNDGRIDAFVTNDNLPNFLFRNLGNGQFEEVGLLAGVALGDNGKAVASMGVDFRDLDNDGRPDIVFTALSGETFPYFGNAVGGQFIDRTAKSNLARLSNAYAGWGMAIADFDNDGNKDIFTANSHVNDIVEKFEATTYRQSSTLFRNNGKGQFDLAVVGLESVKAAYRGGVAVDLDGDGKLDLVLSVLGGHPQVWRNRSPDPSNYIAIALKGTRSNRDGIGAIIRVGNQVNSMTTAVGYASSVHTPVHFGIGESTQVDRIEIRWPSGKTQVLTNQSANQTITIIEP